MQYYSIYKQSYVWDYGYRFKNYYRKGSLTKWAKLLVYLNFKGRATREFIVTKLWYPNQKVKPTTSHSILSAMRKEGLIEYKNHKWFPTLRGIFIANEILKDVMANHFEITISK